MPALIETPSVDVSKPLKTMTPEKSQSQPLPTSDEDLPDRALLDQCADLTIFDAKGTAHPFGTLYPSPSTPNRSLIIFVRHFFCGMCQDYLTHLSTHLPPSSLPSNTTITIIGCGDPSLIPAYITNTSCTYPIYADPSRALYSALSLTSTLDGGAVRPAYQSGNVLSMIARNAAQMVGSGVGGLKGGNFSQVGGEFLVGAEGVVWGHRMGNTRDHSDVDVLKKVLGVEA